MKTITTPILRPLTIAAACALAVLAAPPASAQAVATKASYKPHAHKKVDDSLYLALGSQPGVTRLVDDFVPRLVADHRIGDFYKHANLPHLKQMLAEEFCAVSGGGCVYSGLSMKVAHQDMDISKGDFNALVEELQFAMEDQGIPFPTQNRLLSRLAPMHRDIVHVD